MATAKNSSATIRAIASDRLRVRTRLAGDRFTGDNALIDWITADCGRLFRAAVSDAMEPLTHQSKKEASIHRPECSITSDDTVGKWKPFVNAHFFQTYDFHVR